MTSRSKNYLRLKDVRIEHGLTQTALAELSGYAQSQIWRWETGKECPSARVVYDLICTLCVEPNDIFIEDWKEPDLVYSWDQS